MKPSVRTFNDLPTTGNTRGDVRLARDNGCQYIWTLNVNNGPLSNWILVSDNKVDIATNPISQVPCEGQEGGSGGSRILIWAGL